MKSSSHSLMRRAWIRVALIGLIVFAQSRARERFHDKDWRVETQERMARIQNWLRTDRMPGHGDRVNQLDVRVGKIFRFGARRASVNLDIYNMLNANPVMQENPAYQVWRTPQRIMDARLFKISGQFDF